MKINLGTLDRTLRALVGLAMLACSVFAPLPLAVRAVAFGVLGCYMLLSALAGRCLGYGLLGLSTCRLQGRS